MNAVIAVIENIGRLTNGEPLRLITMAKLVFFKTSANKQLVNMYRTRHMECLFESCVGCRARVFSGALARSPRGTPPRVARGASTWTPYIG
jgi:hypothetical protein